MLSQEFSQPSQISSCDLLIRTADTFQGNERDVMIFTPSVDESCGRSAHFMEESRHFNVATSRAKYFTFFVHGALPENMERMNRLVSMSSRKPLIVLGFIFEGWKFGWIISSLN